MPEQKLIVAAIVVAALLMGCNRNLTGDYVGPTDDYEPRPVTDEEIRD